MLFNILRGFLKLSAYFAGFTVLPAALLIGLSWGVHSFADMYLGQSWMTPLLVSVSTFFGGVIIRYISEYYQPHQQGLVWFVIGFLSLIAFTGLTWVDIHQGYIYSQYMPRGLSFGSREFIYLLPVIGLCGMTFFRFFTIPPAEAR